MSPSNEGLSIWVFQGSQLTYLCENPRGYPKFNSNFVYVVMNKSKHLSVLGDTPYDAFIVYVWIGSRAQSYHVNFETAMDQLNDLTEDNSRRKIRIHVETQYNESF